VTKADIVHAIYSKLGGFSKKEASDLVDLVFETMKETLGRGEKIKISGFGNFVLRDKRQRQGRNPQTGEPITITARRVLNFKASQLLKQFLNDEISDMSGDGGDLPRTSGSDGADSDRSDGLSGPGNAGRYGGSSGGMSNPDGSSARKSGLGSGGLGGSGPGGGGLGGSGPGGSGLGGSGLGGSGLGGSGLGGSGRNGAE
jgi:integration host factor subunit alpha